MGDHLQRTRLVLLVLVLRTSPSLPPVPSPTIPPIPHHFIAVIVTSIAFISVAIISIAVISVTLVAVILVAFPIISVISVSVAVISIAVISIAFISVAIISAAIISVTVVVILLAVISAAVISASLILVTLLEGYLFLLRPSLVVARRGRRPKLPKRRRIHIHRLRPRRSRMACLNGKTSGGSLHSSGFQSGGRDPINYEVRGHSRKLTGIDMVRKYIFGIIKNTEF